MSNEEKKTKGKSKLYPAITFEDAIAFVEKFKNYPREKSISYEIAAKAVSLKKTTKSFKYSVSAAKQFGLISTGPGEIMVLQQAAHRLIEQSESEDSISKLKKECFAASNLYGELVKEYEGRAVPDIDTLDDVLTTHYGIQPTVSKKAAQIFIDSANYVGIVENGVLSFNNEPAAIEYENEEDDNLNEQTSEEKEALTEEKIEIDDSQFEAPLTIPLENQRKAVLYMPTGTDANDAEYIKDMIFLMLKKRYGVE